MKQLNAYYLRAHTYTLVPAQVRQDMAWMASAGTDIVSLAILEQDFSAAVENIRIIGEEARAVGMKVFAVPARWGGLVAGAPKVPSLYSCQNPGGWVLNRDGSPYLTPFSGVISSVHCPATREFFEDRIEALFRTWDFDGIIFDEPKGFVPDYSSHARETLGEEPGDEAFDLAAVRFYEKLLTFTKMAFPEKTTCMFIHANKSDLLVEACAGIRGLDVYGCDGRPWRGNDCGTAEEQGKVLLDRQGGFRFLESAARAGKQSLWLIENHNMRRDDYELMASRFPEVMACPVDHLLYYYYPRNLENPELAMEIIRRNISGFKAAAR